MRLSQLIGKRTKEAPRESVTASHQILLRGGYVRQVAAGIYSVLPLGKRVLAKIEALVRAEMDAVGGQEVLLPVVMPRELWEESGRYAEIDDSLVRFKDRNGKDLVLGMTHEEAVVAAARTELTSWRQLPFMLYQIQTKFRDELRPRAGLIRVREFTMKDAYSFHRDAADLDAWYRRCHAAYERIFARVGLKNTCSVESDTGMMGGKIAHEFMLLSEVGEDTLVFCDSCGYAANAEVAASTSTCARCESSFRQSRGIEIGNIFQLGTKYTDSMGMTYLDEQGKARAPLMGCYGIGIGRLLASAIEDAHDERGPVWSKAIAPYQAHLCVLDAADAVVAARAESFYRALIEKGIEVIWDDTNSQAGVQFADADLISAPLRLVVSARNERRGVVEWRRRDGTGQGESTSADVVATVQRVLGDCR